MSRAGLGAEPDDILFGDFVSSRQAVSDDVFFGDDDIRRLMTGPYAEGLRSWGHCRAGVYRWWYATTEQIPEEWKRNIPALVETRREFKMGKTFLTELDRQLAMEIISPKAVELTTGPEHLSAVIHDHPDRVPTVEKQIMNAGVRKRAIEFLVEEDGEWKWLDFLGKKKVEHQGLAYMGEDGTLLGWIPEQRINMI